jgi:hypothetical protein
MALIEGTMDAPSIISTMLDDLAIVAASQPNERLPKEEQIRCSMYAALRKHYSVVCAERGYRSIDDGCRTECDLWASSPGAPPVWIEFKRAWSTDSLIPKPSEQLDDWERDIEKLTQLPIECDRYFVLVGVFNCDPTCPKDSARSGVAKNIRRFYSERLIHSAGREFTWRNNDGIARVAAWVWHWPNGVRITLSR